MLYGTAVTGGLVEQLGGALDNDTMVTIGVVTSALPQSDAMWKSPPAWRGHSWR